jgi:hypothetical protein
MIETVWERAETAKFPILWYRCYDSSLAVFNSAKTSEKASGERRYYYMRLPYTAQALMNRAANGGNLPVIDGSLSAREPDAVSESEAA